MQGGRNDSDIDERAKINRLCTLRDTAYFINKIIMPTMSLGLDHKCTTAISLLDVITVRGRSHCLPTDDNA